MEDAQSLISFHADSPTPTLLPARPTLGKQLQRETNKAHERRLSASRHFASVRLTKRDTASSAALTKVSRNKERACNRNSSKSCFETDTVLSLASPCISASEGLPCNHRYTARCVFARASRIQRRHLLGVASWRGERARARFIVTRIASVGPVANKNSDEGDKARGRVVLWRIIPGGY